VLVDDDDDDDGCVAVFVVVFGFRSVDAKK